MLCWLRQGNYPTICIFILSKNWQVYALLFSSRGIFAINGSSKAKNSFGSIRTNHTQTRCAQYENTNGLYTYRVLEKL